MIHKSDENYYIKSTISYFISITLIVVTSMQFCPELLSLLLIFITYQLIAHKFGLAF